MVTEITDGVYDITCAEGVGRVRAFLLEDGTLVDAGLPTTTDALFDGIEATGIEPERLLLTHTDPDHVGGFDAVVDRFAVETWVPATAELDTDHEPDHRFDTGDRIGRFEGVHVPGHTPESSAFVDEDRGLLVAGDTVVGSDWRGLPPGYLLPPPEYFTDDLPAAEANLETLLDYDFGTALVFHGSSVLEDAAERLDAFVNFPGKGR